MKTLNTITAVGVYFLFGVDVAISADLMAAVIFADFMPDKTMAHCNGSYLYRDQIRLSVH